MIAGGGFLQTNLSRSSQYLLQPFHTLMLFLSKLEQSWKKGSFLSGYKGKLLGGVFFCLYETSAEDLGDIAVAVLVCSPLEKSLNFS